MSNKVSVGDKLVLAQLTAEDVFEPYVVVEVVGDDGYSWRLSNGDRVRRSDLLSPITTGVHRTQAFPVDGAEGKRLLERLNGEEKPAKKPASKKASPEVKVLEAEDA